MYVIHPETIEHNQNLIFTEWFELGRMYCNAWFCIFLRVIKKPTCLNFVNKLFVNIYKKLHIHSICRNGHVNRITVGKYRVNVTDKRSSRVWNSNLNYSAQNWPTPTFIILRNINTTQLTGHY